MKIAAAATLLLVILTGCSTPTSAAPTGVSAACTAALVDLQNEPSDASFDDEDALILASLKACSSAGEYLAGVKANPESWLWTRADAINTQVLFVAACNVTGGATTDVCVDAKAQGLLDN